MNRRSFLLAPGLAWPQASSLGAASDRRPRVAIIMNVYFPNSHADVFVGRLLEGYRLNGVSHRPRLKTLSFFCDQFPNNDMAREQAQEYGVKLFPDIPSALRLGGPKLAVDGVAIIGEHGDYPRTPRGNVMYPRAKWFDAVAEVMEQDGRIIPIFHDKYFAYEWADALRIYNRIQALKIPYFGGSSLPLTWRRPPLEFARGVELEEVLAVSFCDIEEHGYHALELMQAMAERRKGGETGVEAVRYVEGPLVWELGQKGEWSETLLELALSRKIHKGPPTVPASQWPQACPKPQAILIRYRDGLKGTVLNLNGLALDYLFAARERSGALHSSCFYIQLYLHNHWGFMVRHFEELVLTRKTQIPPERVLLSTGLTLFGLESRLRGGGWLSTPELAIRYIV
ncbi:MAG: hypothetical protein NZV14_17595 [Bryobacteraceae bacterium]|nr:hypothetical protein [Bryobacteraceae bacterium]MDW8379977.1 hypothetical protein [Bryobacterales bacterium]